MTTRNDRRLKSLDCIVLDAAPLVAYVEVRGGFNALCKDEYLRRRYVIVKQRGTISVGAADRICVRGLKVNPAIVFGASWWQTDDWCAPKRKISA